MKVLIIAPQPFFRIRGTPINVKNVAGALSAGGYEVDLLCYPFGDDPDDLPGVTVHRGPGFPGIKDVKIGPSLAKIPLDILLFFKAWGLCRRQHYAVIHAVEESVFFSVWLKRRYKTELIYDMDSVISDQLRYSGKVKAGFILRGIERMERWAIGHARFVLTVCRSLSEKTAALDPHARIVQIEDAPVDETYAPDPSMVNRIRTDYALGDAPVVGYTGNLESYQGFDLVVDAIPTVLRERPDVRVLCVGGQPGQIAELRERLSSDAEKKAVVFAGVQPMEEMSAYLAASDLLVSPRKEGTNTALKIYSYMQSGKPIVATRLATHTQVLDDDCAMLVEPSANAIAEGMLAVLRDSDHADQLGKAAARRVEEQYSLPQFRRRVIDAYAQHFRNVTNE